MVDVLLGLGSNVGDPEANLRAALRALAGVWQETAVSSIWRTEPVGLRDQPWFLNQVARGRTDLDPGKLLAEIARIESALGRERVIPNGPRTLDIDILLYGDRVVDRDGLVIPHPRMHERRFVLEPAVEIAPQLRHPVRDRTLAQLLEDLEDASAVKRM